LKKKKNWKKRILWTLTIVFVLANTVAAFHAYKFTHFGDRKLEKTKDAKKLTTGQKVKAMLFGVSLPRPANQHVPATAYETIRLKSNKEIECWNIPAVNPKGTVILFHGFGGEKSSMLDRAMIFRELGYNTFLVDFMGSGGSEGNQTTIGFLEAKQVRTCFDYLASKGESRIYLFGSSMGAVAIMKAINDYNLQPAAIMIECPFGSMYKTVCARFKNMGVPAFPMAGLLVFWGGIENGFWAFGHNPTSYAKKIHCPTLLLYGTKDDRVSRQEIDEIFTNLGGQKKLRIYDDAGHENYLTKYKSEWTQDITQFLEGK
jgi:alpha-beta hydrolase superfamily lysophospholipase